VNRPVTDAAIEEVCALPSFEDARRMILGSVVPLGPETVSLAAAAGRVLAEDVAAPWDLPQWDNSAMDGYAVRSADLADDGAPEGLAVTGYLPAGVAATVALGPGTAIRIMTGAPLPPGADAIVPIEDADERDGRVVAVRRPVPGDHVRRRAGDVRAGDVVMRAGIVLGPSEVSLLASLSLDVVAVGRRPRVAILSTGDELLAVGRPLEPGRIYDSNGPGLAAAVRRAGAEPVVLPVAPDEREPLRAGLEDGLREDALITTAGVSVGDRDLVRECLRGLGVREVFARIDIQPGRPTTFGVSGSHPVFALPGNPVAALLTFELLARPALRRMLGHARPVEAPWSVVLAEAMTPRADRVTLLRVGLARSGTALVARSAGRQATGFLRTMVDADAIAIIPAGDTPLAAGTIVDAYLLREAGELGGG
jgi:molybdopterin molybdotransferase